MRMIEINLQPSRRELRQFGAIACGAFLLLGGLVWVRGGLLGLEFGALTRPIGVGLGALGLLSGLLGWVAPAANRPLYVGLLVVTYPIGFVLSYLILGILFYGVITPIGLLLRALGHDPMQRRFEPERSTYWSEVKRRRSQESYFRQF